MPPEVEITPAMIAAGVDALWDAHIYDSDNPNGATPEEAVTEIFQAMTLASSVALSKASS